MEKRAIARALDEPALFVPELLKNALAANERAKYYIALLQLARAHADNPDQPAADLASERERLGIADAALDHVVEGSAARSTEVYAIPRVGEIAATAIGDVEAMMEPIHVVRWDGSAFDDRLRAIKAACRTGPDRVTNEVLDELTSADRERDSLHLLVMDVHKALDELGARFATETIAGASAFGLEPRDRPLVEAFAEGVRENEHLKLGHPGLGTTATRYGGALVLENDIGATDAHVVIVRVEGSRATITATDVHIRRLTFLQRLLDPLEIRWEDLHARRQPALNLGESFYQLTGTFEAPSNDAMARFLRSVGEGLVFLIDWNRARKQLERFVSKKEAVELLAWAAHERIGHRAFLEAGGADLVFAAMAAVMRAPIRFGERLDDVLGAESASSFLRFVLRESTGALLGGRSRALLRERVRADLAALVEAIGERLLEPVFRHAKIIEALAEALRGALDSASADLAPEAKRRESEADGVVIETRAVVARIAGTGAFRRILENADDAADALEEASFRRTLLPEGANVAPLAALADLAVDAARLYIQAIEHARRAPVDRDAMEALLDAVDRLVQRERDADVAERDALNAFMQSPVPDARALLVSTTLAHEIEKSTDALARAGLELRDHVVGA